MPDQTLQEIAKETHAAVVALRELIEREYPSRGEVERRFTKKNESNKKLAFGLVILFITVVVSYFMTVATISSCFLGGVEHPDFCNVLPGYAEADERGKNLIEEFVNLQERSIRNEKRIDQLEAQAKAEK